MKLKTRRETRQRCPTIGHNLQNSTTILPELAIADCSAGGLDSTVFDPPSTAILELSSCFEEEGLAEDNFAPAEEEALLPRPFVFATCNVDDVLEDVRLVVEILVDEGEGIRDLLAAAGAGDGMRDLEEVEEEDGPDAANDLPLAIVEEVAVDDVPETINDLPFAIED